MNEIKEIKELLDKIDTKTDKLNAFQKGNLVFRLNTIKGELLRLHLIMKAISR